MSIYIGLDIGGTKIMAASAHEDGSLLQRLKRPTPFELEGGLSLINRMIEHVTGNETIQAIGVGVGGPLDYKSGVISPLHQPTWRNVPFKQHMETHWGVPCYVDVDTNAAGLGEYHFVDHSPPRLLYLTLSTGIGGSLILDGEIYRGAGGMHTEIGHQTIHHRYSGDSDLACVCGASNCLTTLISGSGIERAYGVNPANLPESSWVEVAFNLGQGLRNLATIYVPDLIVLGGGVTLGGGESFVNEAKRVMEADLKLIPPPAVRLSKLGYDTVLFGAIALAIHGPH